jgi:hypothetical protein
MVAKKRAVCDAAIAVAESYGPNVSKGILKMEERIILLEEKLNPRVKELRTK